MDGRRSSGPHRSAAILGGALLALMAAIGPWSAHPTAAASGIDITLPTGHVISGRVTGPGGTPIAGIGLQAQGSTGSGQGISAADGTYTIPGLRDDAYQILFLPQSRSVYLPHYYGAPVSSRDPDGAIEVTVSGADVADIDQELEIGARLSGIISGVAGSPVTGIQVNARGQIGSGTALVAADGTYQVVGLFPSTYKLSIYTPADSPYTAGVVQDGVVIEQTFGGTPYDATAGDVTGADFALVVGVAISGHVAGGDGPVQVDAFETAAGIGFGSTVSTGGGDFTVRGLWPGNYIVLFTVPNDPDDPFAGAFPYGAYADGAIVDQNSGVPVDASAGDVTLLPVTIATGAAMSGTIRRGTAAAAGEFIGICDVNEELGCVGITTKSNGTWRIGHFETGDWIIRVWGGFYSTSGFVTDRAAATPVHIDSSGPNVTGIDVTLPNGGSISGRITGPVGEPVVGAHVFASANGGIGPGGGGNGSCVTGSDGRYTCGPLLQDMYVLSVNPNSDDAAHPGTPYLFGYYDAAAPGHYTADFAQRTLIQVVDPTDHTPPSVVGRTPSAGATSVPRDVAVTAVFSEGVNGVTGKTFTLVDTQNGQSVGAVVSYDPATKTATLRPKALLPTNRTFRMSLTTDIKDWNGNRLVATSWTFKTTADSTPPKIVTRVPAANATGVVTYTAISATFSEQVAGVDAPTFVIVAKHAGTVVNGDISYDPATQTATFLSFNGLNPNTTYQVTLKSGIHDLAGNPLAQSSWTFKTGP